MIFLFLTLSLLAQESKTLALDEIYLDDVGFSHQIGNDVLFSTFSGMSIPLYHFSFDTKRVTEIQDGRIAAKMPFILSHDNQFILLNVIGNLTLFYLDEHGNFLKKQPLDLQLDPGERVADAIQGKNNAWLTLFSKEGSCLVKLDLVTLETTRMTCENDPEYPNKLWFEFQENLYKLTLPNGEIELLNEDFSINKVINRGIEPVLNTITRRQKYFSPLAQPITVLPDLVSFTARELRTPFGDELEDKKLCGVILNNDLKVQKKPYHVIAKNSDHLLVVNRETKELLMITP